MRRPLVATLLSLSLAGVPAAAAFAQVAAGTKGATAKPSATTRTPPASRTAQPKPVPRPTVVASAKRPAPRRPLRPAIAARTPTSADQLRSDLASLVSISTLTGRWGVVVVSLTRGDTLFGHNADELLLPASTMKLYTSAMALERFGPTHQFSTEVLRDGAVLPDGSVEGSLYLKGAGDPSLTPRQAAWNDGARAMDAIAAQVVAAGIRHVKGDIVGDATAFDGERVPAGWRSRYLQASYAVRVSALSFNENLAHITVRPSSRGAVVAFSQRLSGLTLRSSVTVRPGSRGASVRVWQDTLTDRFRVSGWIGAQSRVRTYSVVVEQPERFVAAAFRASLEARGVKVDGLVRIGAAPPAAERITAWASAPMAQLVTTMNGESNNHFAELLFRNSAVSTGAIGSAVVANESLRTFLSDRVGARPDAVFAADGSGLSTLDRVTPRSMVQLLGYTAAAPWGLVLQSSLPVAGRTETLRTRMRRTPAQGNLHGKTGTTNDVSSLGGYVTAKNGEELAFSFIYNGRDLWRARAAIDAMGVTLASFSR